MSTSIAMHAPKNALPKDCSLVSDVSGALRVLRNLSRFGRKAWLDRALSSSAVTQRIDLRCAGGETVTVEVAGNGQPMLLLHGLGGSRHDWDAALASLSREYRACTMDLSGHGSRVGSHARATLAGMARDVAQVLQQLSLSRVLLVGHSMGALVAMQYLQLYGAHRLAGLCIIDQSPRVASDEQWQLGVFGSLTRDQIGGALTRMHGDFPGTVLAEGARLLDRVGLGHEGIAGRALEYAVAALCNSIGEKPLLSLIESVADADFRPLIPRIPVPTLVLLGGASHHYGGLPLADYYLANLARGTVVTYDSCTHSPHRQAPEDFANDLMDFAQRVC